MTLQILVRRQIARTATPLTPLTYRGYVQIHFLTQMYGHQSRFGVSYKNVAWW